ncbi:symplekin [Caerostris extrusa]|uniref:Symplekin n=1 Tax=Caerostris extrusa TaxID=172846 RepID=A0AAV4XL16_CAEEX|nr:symplekin [Caerostris extrusa]
MLTDLGATNQQISKCFPTIEAYKKRPIIVDSEDLSLVSMLSLPEIMPTHFQSTYTPIANAGTEPQDDEEDKPIRTIVGQTVESKPKKQPLVLIPSGGPPTKSNKFSKKVDFSSKVKPLTSEEADRMSRAAFNRIINSENIMSKTGALPMRAKLLTTLATEFRGDFATDLRNHILENPKNRIDLAFTWIYQEYSACRGFLSSIEKPIEFYEETIDKLLKGILENEELKDTLYNRFLH